MKDNDLEKIVVINFYYDNDEIEKKVNKIRAEKKYDLINSNIVKNAQDNYRTIHKFVKFVLNDFSQSYDLGKRKMKISIQVPHGKEEEMSWILKDFNIFITDKLTSVNPRINEQEIKDFFNNIDTKKFAQTLEEKLIEKKDDNIKLKIWYNKFKLKDKYKMKNGKNNNYFKMPSLQKDWTLKQEDALAIYKYYLSLERLDYSNNMRRPCRFAILKAMIKTHEEYNDDATKFITDHMKNGGKVYFWSDQHFYHRKIIEHASRPFESMEQMNKEMLSNYFKTIRDEDLVVFGGDVAFGEVEDVKTLLQHLPGKKILVLGNHDFDKNDNSFRDYGIFDIVTMAFTYQELINNEPVNIIVTHYPIENKWLPENTLNIHGHIHQHLADKNNINIAVEHMHYMPRKLDEIIKKEYKEDAKQILKRIM